MNLNEAEAFLQEVKKIYSKVPIREKTFMEVEGYPHYENVISNILTFYLNPEEEHKLNDLAIKALLNVIKCKNIDTSHFNIYREYTTIKGKRIDIVMQNEDIVIGIENKIDASVYNDLEDYAKTLNKLNNNSIKILLSLHKENIIQSDFINVTYSDYLKQLKSDLSSYPHKENKWYIYLIDFINNLKDFEVEKEMEQEINNWINAHKQEIKEFKKILNVGQNNINKKLNEYENILKNKISNLHNVKYYNSGEEISSTAYIVFDSGCNLDAKLDTTGWTLGIFIWKKSSQFKIKEILNNKGMKYVEESGHLWVYKLDYDVEIEKVVDKAIELYNIIDKKSRIS